MGVICGAGTVNTSGATEFNPSFLLEIVLSVLLRSTASDYPFWYLQTFRREKAKGKSRMDNQEMQVTLDTRHRIKTNKANTTQKTNSTKNRDEPKC